MRILIVSMLFAPNNAIGAVRPTKIAEHLAEKGHLVDVVTYGGQKDESFLTPSKLHKVYHMTPYEKDKNTQGTTASFHKSSQIVDSIKLFYRGVLSERKGSTFVAYFKDLFESELKNQNYDTLITSFGPLACLKCGIYVKKRLPEINWICDFRDPVVGGNTSPLLYGHWKSIQDKSCRMADKIVAVSSGYIDSICGDKYKEKRFMIPNGYDVSDRLAIGDFENSNILTFAYAGALYEGKRDLSALFKALAELKTEQKISFDKIKIKYAGSDFEVLRQQSAKFDVEEILENKGRLSRSDCLKFQYEAQFLILATWNTKKDKGIFPGKFLEYMLIGRPIISITTGELSNSEVTNVINEGHLGVAYEAARDKQDFDKLKEYIEEQYNYFVSNGCIQHEPVPSVVDRYDYNNIMAQIEKLL